MFFDISLSWVCFAFSRSRFRRVREESGGRNNGEILERSTSTRSRGVGVSTNLDNFWGIEHHDVATHDCHVTKDDDNIGWRQWGTAMRIMRTMGTTGWWQLDCPKSGPGQVRGIFSGPGPGPPRPVQSLAGHGPGPSSFFFNSYTPLFFDTQLHTVSIYAIVIYM